MAITMGDAAGIGPELIVKALSQGAAYESCCPLVVTLQCGNEMKGEPPRAMASD